MLVLDGGGLDPRHTDALEPAEHAELALRVAQSPLVSEFRSPDYRFSEYRILTEAPKSPPLFTAEDSIEIANFETLRAQNLLRLRTNESDRSAGLKRPKINTKNMTTEVTLILRFSWNIQYLRLSEKFTLRGKAKCDGLALRDRGSKWNESNASYESRRLGKTAADRSTTWSETASRSTRIFSSLPIDR